MTSAIEIRTGIESGATRRRVAGLVVLIVLAVVIHHAQPEMPGGDGMHHMQSGSMGLMTMCLGVLGLGALALTAVRVLRMRSPRLLVSRRPLVVAAALRPPLSRARAGPTAVLQVFRL